MRRTRLPWLCMSMLLLACTVASADWVETALERHFPALDALYIDLHGSPELSLMEERTAAKMAAQLERLGFAVTRGVGGHGVVGLLRNGDGPIVMLRADIDGLPVTEQTGKPYASTVRTTDAAGASVGVMHACGHDVHMTGWVGAATILAQARERWSGTLMFVAQPAEERGLGARAMLDDGLFERFPKPDYAFALHTSASQPAGDIAYTPGPALASVDSVDIRVHGVGGHGAYPHTTVDPIVIAARIVVTLQTVVAREVPPLEPAVITVGSFHAGSKHNIISDRADLQLTVRAYSPEVRRHLLAAIERIAEAEAAAAGAPRPPEVAVSEGTPPTTNDPRLSERLARAIGERIGADHVRRQQAVMGGEDFSHFGLAGVPAAIFWVGGVERERWEAAQRGEASLPSLHSPLFAPDRGPTLRTAVRANVSVLLELLAQ